MKNLGRVAAFAGFVAAIWLLWHDNPRAVLSLMRAAGAGLLLAGLVVAAWRIVPRWRGTLPSERALILFSAALLWIAL